MVEDYKGYRGDDSLNGWYVDHRACSDAIDRRGPGFSTLREAVEEIDRAVAADLRCPHCDLYIGDTEWPGMPSVDHDIDECAECSEQASDCLCDGGEREPDLDALTEALQEEN